MSDAGRPPRTHAPYVFVEDLDAPVLPPEDHHHLARVLRVAAGAEVVASDGRGRWRLCRFGDALVAEDEVRQETAPSPLVTVAFAVPKGDRPELVVQKLTELGVDRIVPFFSARSVVWWDQARAAKQVERLRRVAREAAMQSRRIWLPTIDEPSAFGAVVRGFGDLGLTLAERDGAPPSLARPVIAVGPEGGWSDDERAAAPHVALAGGVLRAETAAIAAGVMLAALRSGLVGPAGGV